MSRVRTQFSCNECGALSAKWSGQCPECGAWNTLVETAVPRGGVRPGAAAGGTNSRRAPTPQRLDAVGRRELQRVSSSLPELDRVLGGGFVPGSVILLGGDPGIGKSTLLLQSAAGIDRQLPALYVSGEESTEQVAMRAARLGIGDSSAAVLTENVLDAVLAAAQRARPGLVVIDSIQTLYTDALQSAPGSVAQVRECAAELVRYAKASGAIVVLVGHVTKEGSLAGPRVLEHMVDTVLYFEGDRSSSFRLVRAIKNRFGAVNELGVFAMTEHGLREVGNPSAMFVNRDAEPAAGSVTLATQEGTRPLLVEVQALVDVSPLANPRRLSVGLDGNRLAMLLAVLHRHAGIALHDQDVFVNVVGGVRVTEPAADLAVALAAVSSLRDRAVTRDTVVFGEVGLSGEVRPVQRGLERLREASKLGFRRAVLPAANRVRPHMSDLELVLVSRIDEALAALA